MQSNSWRLPCTLLLFQLVSVAAHAEPVADSVNYLRDIKPLLKARCYACHGSLKQESGLRLDAGRLIRNGSQNGKVMTVGESAGPLIERIRSTDPAQRMPPEGEPLSADQIRNITRWIEQGAVSPDAEQPELDPRSHWAFQPPRRPPVPAIAVPEIAGSEIAGADPLRNPIDAFLATAQTDHQLKPQPAASKSVLLRRVTLDLTGLPPTTEELRAFLADASPEAYGKVVDRLLNSAQYGERWGRHWMDVWRYSDWYGRRYVPDVWNSAPQIWRWRDWIVKSLNEDKSYGQMVAEMLAADEIAPENDEAGYATGYLIRNWYALNPNDWMRSNVEHTGKAFLGLTLNCAHCHDHKYDPISQADYFRFRAFFEPISIRQDRVPGEADPGPFQEYDYSVLRKINRLGAVRIFDKHPEATTWFYTGGDERNRLTDRGSIPAGIPVALANGSFPIDAVALPPRAWYPGLRPAIHETILAEHRAALAAIEAEIPSVRTAVEAVLPEFTAKLAAAEGAFAQARIVSRQAGRLAGLSGDQSLLLDATTGRRLVQHRLQQLKQLDEKATIRFQLQILKDAHVNFQLGKDVIKGLTAGYVAFDAGRIMSYQPASFTEFEVGRYDFSAGQNRFEVSLQFQLQADRCLLSVRALADDRLLVDHVPVARNGWNPVGDPTKGISFDAHTGAIAAIDDISLIAPRPAGDLPDAPPIPLVQFDFEAPLYRDGEDIIGIDGWIGSSFSQPGATSLVSTTFGDPTLKPFSQQVIAARLGVDVHRLKLQSLEARRVARMAEIESTHARIAADRAKYGELPGANVDELTRLASLRSREAAARVAEADLLTRQQLLAAAEVKPLDDANRAKEMAAASQQLATAQTALESARMGLADHSLSDRYPPFSPTYPAASTGRRRALALWIASRENPLTARVAVNHIWLRHFHSPLVATVTDFGRNGTPPTHPELLDWLAVEFMESGWSMKHLHRLIVTSQAYGMSSASGPADNPARKLDPENRWLWRMNAGRMEAEVIRDSLLFCAGKLDPQLGGQELENSQALTTRRRTLYYSCQPEIDGKSSLGTLFDAPEPADCYRRSRSIIPQQALALTNSTLVHELSGFLATTLWESLSPDQQADPAAFIIAAHERILSRQPTDSELHVCLVFLLGQGQGPGTGTGPGPGPGPGEEPTDLARQREGLVRALFNHNDFVAIR